MFDKLWAKVEPYVERKVAAATTAGAVSGLVIWLLHHYSVNVPQAESLVQWLVPIVLTGIAGYIAKHTPRGPVTVTKAPVDLSEKQNPKV